MVPFLQLQSRQQLIKQDLENFLAPREKLLWGMVEERKQSALEELRAFEGSALLNLRKQTDTLLSALDASEGWHALHHRLQVLGVSSSTDLALADGSAASGFLFLQHPSNPPMNCRFPVVVSCADTPLTTTASLLVQYVYYSSPLFSVLACSS